MIKKFIVKGLVQGIGYRPWVARLAEELNIAGWVRNTGGIVTVLAKGDEDKLDLLESKLSCDVPTGGFVVSIEAEELTETQVNNLTIPHSEKNQDKGQIPYIEDEFKIIESDQDVAANLPLIPADIATCDKCKKELLDPSNRRFLHPFISCTICGPRYSIIEKLPYDRDTITMGDFDMCPECAYEYKAKSDRRRHAQTIACKECGPVLHFQTINTPKSTSNTEIASNPAKNKDLRKLADLFLENSDSLNQPMKNAIKLLLQGGILAIKDIGGYHLACNPKDEKAVSKLRILKHREAKAFAVMFADIDEVKKYCKVNEQEEKLLENPARPIVLLRKRNDGESESFSENVCLSSPDIGAMLPCNPVQIMLAEALGPLIMTSGNASGDVLETNDDNMLDWLFERAKDENLCDIALGILSHNRRILRPMDDSVMKVVAGQQQFIRRARGFVPNPIPVDIEGEIFGAGGDLKSSFCFVKNGLAYVSQYLGDMESVSCQHFYNNEKGAMKNIFGFNPTVSAVDKHPGYFSRSNVENPLEIQHHKAHVASVVAEHNLKGKVLGFAFDGTGFGDDGTIWGSETFLWDGEADMERVAHLKPSKLIGGNEGAKNCDTILTAMLLENESTNELETKEQSTINSLLNSQEATIIKAAIDNNINIVTSTSMGRLFDAVSAMLDICHYNSYEGQAPIELENVAAKSDKAYKLTLGAGGDTGELFAGIKEALLKNISASEIARGFIEAVADYVCTIADMYEYRLDESKQIVLSGGTFLNRILTERVISKLEQKGFNVYLANQLPPGDGGICLGQVFLASKLQKH